MGSRASPALAPRMGCGRSRTARPRSQTRNPLPSPLPEQRDLILRSLGPASCVVKAHRSWSYTFGWGMLGTPHSVWTPCGPLFSGKMFLFLWQIPGVWKCGSGGLASRPLVGMQRAPRYSAVSESKTGWGYVSRRRHTARWATRPLLSSQSRPRRGLSRRRDATGLEEPRTAGGLRERRPCPRGGPAGSGVHQARATHSFAQPREPRPPAGGLSGPSGS